MGGGGEGGMRCMGGRIAVGGGGGLAVTGGGGIAVGAVTGSGVVAIGGGGRGAMQCMGGGDDIDNDECYGNCIIHTTMLKYLKLAIPHSFPTSIISKF